MKLSDVIIGEIYHCRVSGRLEKVEVLSSYASSFSNRKKFMVKNLRTQRVLRRGPGALRPLRLSAPEKTFNENFRDIMREMS